MTPVYNFAKSLDDLSVSDQALETLGEDFCADIEAQAMHLAEGSRRQINERLNRWGGSELDVNYGLEMEYLTPELCRTAIMQELSLLEGVDNFEVRLEYKWHFEDDRDPTYMPFFVFSDEDGDFCLVTFAHSILHKSSPKINQPVCIITNLQGVKNKDCYQDAHSLVHQRKEKLGGFVHPVVLKYVIQKSVPMMSKGWQLGFDTFDLGDKWQSSRSACGLFFNIKQPESCEYVTKLFNYSRSCNGFHPLDLKRPRVQAVLNT